MLGPLGGPMVAVLLPELAMSFGTSPGGAAVAIPAYMVPFAALQLVSGTLGARLGRRRVVRAAYLTYAVASVAAAAAPGLSFFLAARAAQGAANAFLTPLLLGALTDLVPPRRLGRSVGSFTAAQTAAIAVAPLWGGLLGQASWRLACLALAPVALALAFVPPADAPRRDPVGRSLRSLVNERVARLSAGAFAAFAGVTGIGFLVALRANDAFGVGTGARGLLLALFGVSGVLVARPAGRAADRVGGGRVLVVGAVISAGSVAVVGLAGSPLLLALSWTAAGVGSAWMWSGLNVLTLEAVPQNPAGAASVVGAFKFAGSAVAPLVLIPIYASGAGLAFATAAGVALLAGVGATRSPSRVESRHPVTVPQEGRTAAPVQ
jgi:MFS family permease